MRARLAKNQRVSRLATAHKPENYTNTHFAPWGKAREEVIAKMLIFSYRRIIMAYSPDFRKKVLETLSRGLSVRTTAALFGIHFTTIQNWKKHPEKAKTPQKRPPKKIRTEELLADIEMYPTDYLSERAKRFKCTPAAIRKAMLRNKFSKKRRY